MKKVTLAVNVAISVLSAAVTVLMLIPGEQGETVLGVVLEMLRRFVANAAGG